MPSPGLNKSSPGSNSTNSNPRLPSSASMKDDVDQHGYAVPRDNVVNRPWVGKLGAAGRNGAVGGLKASRDYMAKGDIGGNEYAQPIVPVTSSQDLKPTKASKHRERREQMAMQQGTSKL